MREYEIEQALADPGGVFVQPVTAVEASEKAAERYCRGLQPPFVLGLRSSQEWLSGN